MITKQNVKLFTLLLFLCYGYVFAQNDLITGKVTGPENEGLPGVKIQISGTHSGAITDIDGNYSLEAPPDAILISGDFIRRIPYPDSEIITNQQNVNEAISRQGPDNLDTRIWWDVNLPS